MLPENNKFLQQRMKKGHTNNPNGRKAGVPNKATTNAREAIARFVDGNMERVIGWIEQIDDPKDRVKCVIDLLEYHVPKLARTEVTGKDGGALNIIINSPIKRDA